jgi:hypothetical protein
MFGKSFIRFLLDFVRKDPLYLFLRSGFNDGKSKISPQRKPQQ